MKNISLPNKELRLLSGQLQNFNQGYTVPQIRSLDNVIKVLEQTIKPFTDEIENIVKGPIAFSTQEEREKLEKERDERLQKYVETEGNKIVSVNFEDVDFEFIKQVWSKMGSLSGQKEARETILKIDDAITKATEPVFTKNNVEEKLPN